MSDVVADAVLTSFGKIEGASASLSRALQGLKGLVADLSAVFQKAGLQSAVANIVAPPPLKATPSVATSPAGTPPGGASSAGLVGGFKDISSGLIAVVGRIYDTAAALTGLTLVGTKLGEALTAVASKAASLGSAGLGKLTSTLSTLTAPISKAVAGLAQSKPMRALVSRAMSFGKAVGGMGKPLASIAGGVGKVGASVGSAAMGAASSAVAAPVSMFDGLIKAVSGFVEALNPSALLVFRQAVGDLAATFGVALQPIIQVASQVVRELGSALLPVMRKLQPIMAQVSKAFGEVATVWIEALAQIATAMMPAFKVVADLLTAMSPIVQTVVSGFASLVEVVSDIAKCFDWVGTAFTETMRVVLTALNQMAKVLMGVGLAVARIMSRAVGGGGGAVTGGVAKESAEGLKAAKDGSIGSISEFGKAVTRSALMVSPQDDRTQPKSSEALLAGIGNKLDVIAAKQGADAVAPLLSRFQRDMELYLDRKFDEARGPTYNRGRDLALPH